MIFLLNKSHASSGVGKQEFNVLSFDINDPFSFLFFFFLVFKVYPSWCSQPIVVLPLVYQQVFEASCVQGLIQTPILYPILLLSGLRQDQLSQIWSQVNLKHPGTLIKEELFMALALIALAQNNNGQIFSNDRLYNLIEIPLPHFQIEQQQQQQQSSTTSSCFVSSPSSSSFRFNLSTRRFC